MSEVGLNQIGVTAQGGLLKGTALEVRYQEKDEAKALGAVWDNELRRWYVPSGRDLRPFLRWLPRHVRLVNVASTSVRVDDPSAVQLARMHAAGSGGRTTAVTSLGRAPKLIPPKSLLATFEDAGHPIDGEPGAVQEKHGGSDEDTLGPGGEPDAGGDWLFAVFA